MKEELNELALFAGAGGGILGGHLLGWRTVCAVEWEQYPASVLCARQNDGLLSPFPIWDDVQTFDGSPWRGIVDVVSGGFPCQDISSAGGGSALMANAALCGEKWHGWLARFDPATSLWKTAQCSLLEDSTECYQTFTNWGLMRDGELWAQTMLAHPIEGNDFGWLPTPVATDYMNGQVNGITYTGKRFVRKSKKTGTEFGAKLTSAYRLMTGNRLPASFSEWMMGWPQEWTELRPQGTGKFHKWQQQHGGY
jgi:DNA (cytosine-5)-methyltransferase 1